MFWTILGIIFISVIAYRVYNDDNKDLVAWRNGDKGEAVLWFLLYCLKSLAFAFCLPFLFFIFFIKD